MKMGSLYQWETRKRQNCNTCLGFSNKKKKLRGTLYNNGVSVQQELIIIIMYHNTTHDKCT